MINFIGEVMKRYMEKTVLGFSVVLLSASLLTACNTVEGTAVGLGRTATGAVAGAGKDIHAVERTMTPGHKKAVHHKAHKKAVHHKAHKKTHHKAMKKDTEVKAAQ